VRVLSKEGVCSMQSQTETQAREEEGRRVGGKDKNDLYSISGLFFLKTIHFRGERERHSPGNNGQRQGASGLFATEV